MRVVPRVEIIPLREAETPPQEWAVVEGRLPSPAPGKWRVLASGNVVGCGVLGSLEVETAVLVSGLGLTTRSGRHVPRELELEGRHLPFPEDVSEFSETD